MVVECDENRGEEIKRWLKEAMVEGMDAVMNGICQPYVPVEVEMCVSDAWRAE